MRNIGKQVARRAGLSEEQIAKLYNIVIATCPKAKAASAAGLVSIACPAIDPTRLKDGAR